MRKKTLLALFVAAGVLTPQLSAAIENGPQTAASMIDEIAAKSEFTPQRRAFDLITIAHSLLNGHSVAEIPQLFSHVLDKESDRYFMRPKAWESVVTHWSSYASSDFKNKLVKPVGAPSKEASLLAKSATQMAISNLAECTDEFSKLNLYFVASHLFKKLGDTTDMLKCEKILNAAIESFENKNSKVSEAQIKAVSSVLNSMANGFISVEIPTYKNQVQANAGDSYTISDFEKCEALKLKSIEVIDRLPTTSHERRLAHRDMALWYTALHKESKAAAQKHILFNLVGISDDRILFPKSLGCGGLSWWVLESNDIGFDCGMG